MLFDIVSIAHLFFSLWLLLPVLLTLSSMRQRDRKRVATRCFCPGNPDPLSLTLGGPVVPLVYGFIRRDNLRCRASCLRTFTS